MCLLRYDGWEAKSEAEMNNFKESIFDVDFNIENQKEVYDQLYSLLQSSFHFSGNLDLEAFSEVDDFRERNRSFVAFLPGN